MVRLRREMDGLDLDESRVPPPYWAHAGLRAIIDGPLWDRIGRLGALEGARVLLVGLPVEAIRAVLRAKPEHLSLVDPDAHRRAELLRVLEDAGFARSASVFGRHYADMAFERSSFDVAILYDCICRYPNSVNVLRKCARELKMGSTLALRVDLVLDLSSSVDAALARWPIPAIARQRVAESLARRNAGNEWGVDWPSLRDAVSDLVRFGEESTIWGLSPLVANALVRAGKLGVAAAPAVLAASTRADSRLASRMPTVLWAVATKDVQFGRVFTSIEPSS